MNLGEGKQVEKQLCVGVAHFDVGATRLKLRFAFLGLEVE